MSDLSVTVVLPSGGSRSAELPDDVAVKELIPELTTSLELPVTGPDGRPMSYRLDSKASLNNWKRRLSPQEIAQIRAITAETVEQYYPDLEWE